MNKGQVVFVATHHDGVRVAVTGDWIKKWFDAPSGGIFHTPEQFTQLEDGALLSIFWGVQPLSLDGGDIAHKGPEGFDTKVLELASKINCKIMTNLRECKDVVHCVFFAQDFPTIGTRSKEEVDGLRVRLEKMTNSSWCNPSKN